MAYSTKQKDLILNVLKKYNKQFNINYVLSNAELNIYLDAREVLQSNSRPQVSYEIDVSIVNEEFIKTAYKQLNKLA